MTERFASTSMRQVYKSRFIGGLLSFVGCADFLGKAAPMGNLPQHYDAHRRSNSIKQKNHLSKLQTAFPQVTRTI
jgi:hypothetical protein